MVVSICEENTEFDKFWSDMNKLPWYRYYYVAWKNFDRLQGEIGGLESQISGLEDQIINQVSGLNEQVSTLELEVEALDKLLASTYTEIDLEKKQNQAALDYEKERHLYALGEEKKRHKAELEELKKRHRSKLHKERAKNRKLRLHNVSVSDRVQKAADIQILPRMEDRPDFIGPRLSRKANGIDPSPIINNMEA